MITAILPSRNEQYLQDTVNSLLNNALGEIEVIVVLDGYWPDPPIKNDKRVVIIHKTTPGGMRAGINSAVAIAKGEFLMKADAHCMFSGGFDKVLAEDCKENQVMIPRRYPLDVKNWKIEERTDNKYPMDYMDLDSTLHGVENRQKNNDPALKEILIDDLMSSQGSVWFMPKILFHKLDLMDDENYGTFWNEFQEIGLKAWLGGYEVKINKKCWYAHFHKTEGRGYNLDSIDGVKAKEQMEKWFEMGKAWDKQIHDIQWLFKRFNINSFKENE